MGFRFGDSRIESMCIRFYEAMSFSGGKVFEKPATSATPATAKAERVAVQL